MTLRVKRHAKTPRTLETLIPSTTSLGAFDLNKPTDPTAAVFIFSKPLAAFYAIPMLRDKPTDLRAFTSPDP